MLISSVKIQPDHMARGPELPRGAELRRDQGAAGAERLGHLARERSGIKMVNCIFQICYSGSSSQKPSTLCWLTKKPIYPWTADDREASRKGVQGVEGGQDLLRADVQVQAQLRHLRRRDHEIQEEKENTLMVVHQQKKNCRWI